MSWLCWWCIDTLLTLHSYQPRRGWSPVSPALLGIEMCVELSPPHPTLCILIFVHSEKKIFWAENIKVLVFAWHTQIQLKSPFFTKLYHRGCFYASVCCAEVLMCCKCQLSNLFPACAPVCSSCTVFTVFSVHYFQASLPRVSAPVSAPRL